MSSKPGAIRRHRQRKAITAAENQMAAQYVRTQQAKWRRAMKQGEPRTWWGSPYG